MVMDPIHQGHGGAPGIPVDGLGRFDNPMIDAAFTYLGQFIDHDIGLDEDSVLGEPNDPWRIRNDRAPSLSLDSLYGGGPAADPRLYVENSGGLMRVGALVDDGQRLMDLPWDEQVARPLLGDRRNAENFIVSQLHVAFLHFHNEVLRRVREDHLDDGLDNSEDEFERAQRLVRWHYQWIVVREYLPKLVGPQLVSELLDLPNPARLFRPRADAPLWVPAEFSAAVFRFGHSQVQTRYVLGRDFQARVFPENPDTLPWSNPQLPRTDLQYSRASSKDLIDWNFLLKIGPLPSSGTRFSSRIDRRIAPPLFVLPAAARRHLKGLPLYSLPARTLQRQIDFALPSGPQAAEAARRAGVERIETIPQDQLWGGGFEAFMDYEAPLWFYVLAEAEKQRNGEQLGPLGARIVAEVLIGLLRHDPTSWVHRTPDWQPILGLSQAHEFGLADLLCIAKMNGAV
ncbi:MAG: peroxidase family protein [Panacagrimonas sp.]